MRNKISVSNIIVNISPPKSGTTSLYHALARLPEIAPPQIKEPRFFAGEETDIYKEIPLALRVVGNYRQGILWYEKLFSADELTHYKIDFTTYYAVTRETPWLIKRHYPNAAFVFILRDPVKRFISHYFHYAKIGYRMPPLREVIETESDFSSFLFSFSRYTETYDRYATEFGPESICLLNFDDLSRKPASIEKRVSTFFDLPNFVYRPTDKEKNKAGVPRMRVFQNFIFSDRLKRLTGVVPPGLKTRLLQVRKRIVLLNTRTSPYKAERETEMVMLLEKLQPQVAFFNSIKNQLTGATVI
jgi:hypothetical protein